VWEIHHSIFKEMMKRNPKIGLLPLYLKLSDDTMAKYRAMVARFAGIRLEEI